MIEILIPAAAAVQASTKLAEPARIMGVTPAALQLRFLQTVTEIAAEDNSTTLFPIPLDVFGPS